MKVRMQDGELNKLINKYLNKTATASEIKLVDEWYASFDEHPVIEDDIKKEAVESLMSESFNSLLFSLGLKS